MMLLLYPVKAGGPDRRSRGRYTHDAARDREGRPANLSQPTYNHEGD
jgi:hypothetical protein